MTEQQGIIGFRESSQPGRCTKWRRFRRVALLLAAAERDLPEDDAPFRRHNPTNMAKASFTLVGN